VCCEQESGSGAFPASDGRLADPECQNPATGANDAPKVVLAPIDTRGDHPRMAYGTTRRKARTTGAPIGAGQARERSSKHGAFSSRTPTRVYRPVSKHLSQILPPMSSLDARGPSRVHAVQRRTGRYCDTGRGAPRSFTRVKWGSQGGVRPRQARRTGGRSAGRSSGIRGIFRRRAACQCSYRRRGDQQTHLSMVARGCVARRSSPGALLSTRTLTLQASEIHYRPPDT